MKLLVHKFVMNFIKGIYWILIPFINFGKQVDLLTIEIENVNIDALDRLEKEGLSIYPTPKSIRIIQNKATQKNFYNDKNIPTAPFFHYAYLERAQTLF